MLIPDLETKLIRINSLLNIMDRDLYNLSQTQDHGTEYLPERIGDLQQLVISLQEIFKDILGLNKPTVKNC